MTRTLAALALAVLAACAAAPERDLPAAPAPPPEAKLTAALEALCRTIEDENSFAFLDLVAESYAPSKLGLKANVDQELETYIGFTIQLTVEHAEIMEDGATGVVRAGWRMSRSARADGKVDVRDGKTEFRFVRNGSRWMLDLQNGDVLFGQ